MASGKNKAEGYNYLTRLSELISDFRTILIKQFKYHYNVEEE
jgi:hypothetical protein